MRIMIALALAALFWLPAPSAHAQPAPGPQHAIAMHGTPDLPADFAAFPYADPQAPKGGLLRLAELGTFDGLNPFIVKGSTAASGISPWIVQPLMARSYDEPFTLYGLIARTIETPPDRSWVEFAIDPRARFSDGSAVTAEDVAFSWELLRTHGRPNFRGQYNKVAKAEIRDDHHVRFIFKTAGDYELPLILGLMPVFSHIATDPDRFEETSFTAPLGSGPYVVDKVDPGAGITYRRNPHFWADDVPAMRGLYNPETIRIDYYRDSGALFEAFKAGLYDFRIETDPRRWQSGYDFPAVRAGKVRKEAVKTEAPKGMSGFVLNTRRPQFADVRVREALGLILDRRWINRNLYGGALRASSSYFEDSRLSALGRPASAAEQQLLAAFPGAVRPDIMAGTWRQPEGDGSGLDRTEIGHALALLRQAGYAIRQGSLQKLGDGKPLAFEILVANRDDERLALVYADSLARIGVKARVRQVDAVQYEKRRIEFDFDVIINTWPVSASPGNEQRGRWASGAADAPGSLNYAGVRSPAVDAVIDAMLAAREEAPFVTAVRALDRLLMSGAYVVPLFHAPEKWLAYRTRLAHPARLPRYEVIPDAWWVRPDAGQ